MTFYKHKIARIIGVVLLIAAIGYGIERGIDKVSREMTKSKDKKEMAAHAEALNNICLKPYEGQSLPPSDLFAILRHCVHQNSVHNIDDEYYETAETYGQVGFARQIRKYAEGKLNEKPHFECSRRSIVLRDLYTLNGFENRILRVIQRRDDVFLGHIINEVKDPQTGQFQIHDPTFDVTYKSKDEQRFINMRDILMIIRDEFQPCGFDGKCSWDIRSPDGVSGYSQKSDFWDFAYVGDFEDERGVIIYNDARLGPFDKIVTNKDGNKASYCDLNPKFCGNVERVN